MHVSKDKVRCVAVAAHWQIEGDIHLLVGSRLTDGLNSRAKDFLAMTDAVVSNPETGEELYRPSYLALNRESISVIFPVNE